MPDKNHYAKTRDYFKTSALEREGYYDADAIGPRKHSFWQKRVRRMVKHFLDVSLLDRDANDLSLIDVGCGRGDFTIEIAKSYPKLRRVSGCDFSKETLSIAKKNAEQFESVSFHEADLLKMPFGVKDFDLTLCINVLHHVEKSDLGNALSELARITKSILIVEIKNNNNFYYKGSQKSHENFNVFPTTTDEVSGKLDRHNFRLVKKRGLFIFDNLSPMLVLMYQRRAE